MKIGAVVSYCTNDSDFLNPCLDHLLSACDEIVVSYSDKFFDGTPENIELIKKQALRYPQIKFLQFEYDAKQSSRQNHNKQRFTGYKGMDNSIEKDWIIFIDVDEILDDKKFKLWMDEYEKTGQSPPVLRFATYIYFLSPALRSTHLDESFIMIQKNKLDSFPSSTLLNLQWERHSIILTYGKNAKNFVCGLDGYPMCHHYSLVRTKDEMLKKVKAWGHNDDCKNKEEWKDAMNREVNTWTELIDKRFTGIPVGSPEGKKIISSPENRTPAYPDGTIAFTFPPILEDPNPEIMAIDFWHHYKYYWVEPFVNIGDFLVDKNSLYDLLGIDLIHRIAYINKLRQKLNNLDEYRTEFQMLTDLELSHAQELGILHKKNETKFTVIHGKY